MKSNPGIHGILVSIIFLWMVLFSTGAVAQQNAGWMEVPGAYGGTQLMTLTADGTIYADGYYALTRSDDNGHTWERIPNPNFDTIPTGWRPTIIGRAGNLYKRVRHGDRTYFYHSTNRGDTWALFFQSDSIFHLAELSDGTLIGIDSHAVYRSTDLAQHWQKVAGHDTITTRDYSWIYPNGEIWVYCMKNLFLRGMNNGADWSIVPLSAARFWATSKGHIFSVDHNYDFKRSIDGGIIFEPILIDSFPGNYDGGLMVEVNDGKLFFANRFGNYLSADDGISWQNIPSNFRRAGTSYPLFLPADSSILMCSANNQLLYRSTDEGLTWTYSSDGLRAGRHFHFLSPDTIFCDFPQLMRSDNGGQTWTILPLFGSGITYKMAFLQARDSFLVLGKDEDGKHGIFLSPDRGNTFQPVGVPAGTLGNLYVNPLNHAIYCTSFDTRTLRYSTDWGQNWLTAGLNLPDTITWIMSMGFHPSGRIYLLTFRFDDINLAMTYTLFYSDNGGASWNIMFAKSGDFSEGNLHIGKDGRVYVTLDKKLFISPDNGASWLIRRTPFRDSNISFPGSEGLVTDPAGRIFVCDSKAVYSSDDDGISWRKLPSLDTLSDGAISYLFLSPDQFLYAGTRYFMFRSGIQNAGDGVLSGYVRQDADDDCATPGGQQGVGSWVVQALGENDFYSVTDSGGYYHVVIDSGSYSVSVFPENTLWWQVCANDPFADIQYPDYAGSVDFTTIPASDCPLLSVDLTVARLRRCFSNLAMVRYCNQGAETATDAYIDIELDSRLTLLGSELPCDTLGPDLYRFNLGAVAPGYCDQFGITVLVECDSTIFGQTHCITAHAWPDTLCTVLPAWSGAQLDASATCQDSVVLLELRNNGTAISQLLEYIIIEDDVVLMSGQEQYDPGEVKTMVLPANGHTWRIESEQEPGHPFSFMALAFSEGCGGDSSLGYVNQFSVNGWFPSVSRECRQNIGAYDPNDKQGFPTGFGAEHRVRSGQELEYLVRFQNTGTDTAFTVVIRDTLSPWLNPASVRPGAASHDYTWNLSGPGILSFTFHNILLPDSNVNEAASHGFVSFRIAQQPDVPPGAEIFNEAAIYFDFNAPVITNRTLHTVGDDYLVNTYTAPPGGGNDRVLVSPNPAREQAVLRPATGLFDRHLITITDTRGGTVRQTRADGAQYLFECRGLPEGAYFFRVADKNGKNAGCGKIVIKR